MVLFARLSGQSERRRLNVQQQQAHVQIATSPDTSARQAPTGRGGEGLTKSGKGNYIIDTAAW